MVCSVGSVYALLSYPLHNEVARVAEGDAIVPDVSTTVEL